MNDVNLDIFLEQLSFCLFVGDMGYQYIFLMMMMMNGWVWTRTRYQDMSKCYVMTNLYLTGHDVHTIHSAQSLGKRKLTKNYAMNA